MFETRKKLKNKIADLEEKLQAAEQINKLADNSGLAKCTGIICKSCEHGVFVNDWYGYPRLIGCDLTVNCKNYKKKTMTVSYPNVLQEKQQDLAPQ